MPVTDFGGRFPLKSAGGMLQVRLHRAFFVSATRMALYGDARPINYGGSDLCGSPGMPAVNV